MTSTTSNTSRDSSLFSWSCQLSEINLTLQFSEGQSFLTTAFNIEHWNFYLSDYSDATVTKFLYFGWPISYTSSQLPHSSFSNHPSTHRNPQLLRDFVKQAPNYKAIIGSFRFNPFSVDCYTSSTMCSETRLQHSMHGSQSQLSSQTVC